MKRLPKTIKIGCHDYEVALANKVALDDGTPCNGLVSDDMAKIWIERNQKLCKKQEHLLHECLHGLFYGFPFDDDDVEEKVVLFLAPRILQLLRDNPSLISYFIGE